MRLSPEDLKAFQMQRASIQQAAMTLAMLQDSYSRWVTHVRETHGVDASVLFDINELTGELVARG